jgi:V/A-type H+-transporting ATPase subunit D
MTTVQHSQNRAVRMRLLKRRELADHAGSLLSSKEEGLQHERSRLHAHASRSEQQWQQRCQQAGVWLVRARALGADDELRTLIAHGPSPASVQPEWKMSMGIRYPGSVSCDPGPEPVVSSTAALRPTIAAYRDALEAAAQHAAATAALNRLDRELAATRRRRRAIEEHLIPGLDSDIHRLDLALDEQERDEALRVRLAVDRQRATRT